MTSKADRRNEEEKHQKKRIKQALCTFQTEAYRQWLADPKNSGVYKHHGTICSCPMCCNPRKTYKGKKDSLTLPEQINRINEKEMTNEI